MLDILRANAVYRIYNLPFHYLFRFEPNSGDPVPIQDCYRINTIETSGQAGQMPIDHRTAPVRSAYKLLRLLDKFYYFGRLES